MALTMTLKEELARVPVAATPERRAGAPGVLRVARGVAPLGRPGRGGG